MRKNHENFRLPQKTAAIWNRFFLNFPPFKTVENDGRTDKFSGQVKWWEADKGEIYVCYVGLRKKDSSKQENIKDIVILLTFLRANEQDKIISFLKNIYFIL